MRPLASLSTLLALSFAVALGGCGGCDGGGGAARVDGGAIDADVEADGGGAIDAAGAEVDAAPECVGGTLCGQPAACCPAGNECVDDACLPACATGVRCGEDLLTCCDAGDVCLDHGCVVPGAACSDAYDCAPGEFCEPTLDQCLPQPDEVCEIVPTFDTLEVAEEWSYASDQIISIPVVANLDAAGAPEVVVNLSRQGGDWPLGRILVLDGATGATVLGPIAHDPPTSYGSHGRSSIALGDVSGDGLPDIVYAARPVGGKSLIVAIDGDGTLLWRSHTPADVAHPVAVENGAVTLANFDGDPEAEVVVGGTLFDDDGTVLWDQSSTAFGGVAGGRGGYLGSPNSYNGGVAAVADLDDDGAPEIVTGRDAWRVVVTADPVTTATVTRFWPATSGAAGYPVVSDQALDGYPAIADLDGDGTPEVVLVGNGSVWAVDGQTGRPFCAVDPTDALCLATPGLRTAAIAIPGGGIGGPPTIADFDGDGRPEIGVAGASSYTVYDLARPGEDVSAAATPPAAGALFVRWSSATQDQSSNATGSSVFDFQGDGVAEVVYGDECYMRVYRGSDGLLELEIPNTTGTIHEYPLVVDVDGDGNSEILIVANDANAGGSCPDLVSGGLARKGLYVYGDAHDAWVPTRKVWPQHTYHVTNAQSDGNVPATEVDNWTTPGLNNYRQNVQGEGVFNAADLSTSLAIGLDGCHQDELVLKARVTNGGSLGVDAGVPVRFFRGADASGALLGTASTAVALLPGQSTTVELAVASTGEAEDYYAEVGGQDVVECAADNNGGRVTSVDCPIIE